MLPPLLPGMLSRYFRQKYPEPAVHLILPPTDSVIRKPPAPAFPSYLARFYDDGKLVAETYFSNHPPETCYCTRPASFQPYEETEDDRFLRECGVAPTPRLIDDEPHQCFNLVDLDHARAIAFYVRQF